MELNAEPALPLLLRLYRECARGCLEKRENVKIVATIDDYLVRRAICALHPGSHIHTFTRLARSSELGPRDHFDHVKTQLHLQSESARFPTDEEFLRTLESADLYSRPCAQHVLVSLENDDRKEPLLLDEYSLERVMSQQSPLPPAWRDHLGPEHQRIHDRWVHTLGNLTLSRYNSELSALPFARKRDGRGGYKSGPLDTLNADLRQAPGPRPQADAWIEEALQQRGQRLARLALSVWPYPSVPVAKLDKARERAHRVWTLEDHPQLLPGAPASVCSFGQTVPPCSRDYAATPRNGRPKLSADVRLTCCLFLQTDYIWATMQASTLGNEGKRNPLNQQRRDTRQVRSATRPASTNAAVPRRCARLWRRPSSGPPAQPAPCPA